MVDIFRIDTSNLMGSFSTYNPPSNLGYHPLCKIGVYKFDTVFKVVVGTHNFMGSTPMYHPCVSPDGIIVLGVKGNTTVTILKAGTSGFKSNV